MMNDISVIILNWNGKDMMRTFLPSVVRYSSPLGEVIVADNASTDGSVEMLQREFPTVRIMQFDKNYGFAEGYNRALALVRSKYTLLLNSDVEVTEGWLEPLYGYMELHPEVAACQPKIRCQWSKKNFEYAGAAGGFLDRFGYPYCRGRIFDTIEEDNGQYDDIVEVFWVTGAAMMVRTEVYNEVGGLDSRFFAHMEEIDLCWRFSSRGHKMVCVPQSTVFHVGGGTLPKSNSHKTYLNFRNNLLMIYKNASEHDMNSMLFARFWLDALASLVFLLKGQLGDFAAVWRARFHFARMYRDFLSSRTTNMQHSYCVPKLSKSILWAYYVKGKKTWQSFI